MSSLFFLGGGSGCLALNMDGELDTRLAQIKNKNCRNPKRIVSMAGQKDHNPA